MAKLLNVQGKLQGQGEFVVENATPHYSGAFGLNVKGKLELTNLVAGFKLIADGEEVLDVTTNGFHEFRFKTRRYMDSKEVVVAYDGTADVKLALEL